jgi:citrate synthase
MTEHRQYPTSLGVSTLETISLMGQDLSSGLIGNVGFGELAYRLITLEEPTPGQARMFAVLVAFADHGLTPTAIAARLTYLSAPESIQGALASGLLGGGSRFLGVSEDTGRFIDNALADVETLPNTEQGWDEVASEAMNARHAAGGFVPGLGHHLHKNGDPRVPRLMALARETDTFGPHLAMFEAMGRVAPAVTGKVLPLNGAGACGAVLADIGIPQQLLRGVVLLARAAACWATSPTRSATRSPTRSSTTSRPTLSTLVLTTAEVLAVLVTSGIPTPPLI